MIESIFLEVTRECNLRCLFCSNKSCKPLKDEMTTNELLRLVDDLHKIGIRDLRFYGGEPFLRHDLFNVIDKAVSCNMTVSVYTNGTLLNQKKIDDLKRYNVRKLFLSVDSSYSYIHDTIRGVKGSFNKVITNIKTLIKNKLNVEVLLTICRINQDDIKATYRLLHSLGVNNIKANFVSNVGKARQNWNKLSMTINEMQICVRNICEIHLQLFGHIPIRKHCQAGTGELYITANGDVLPCVLFLDEKYRAGNIRSKNIRDILNKPNGLFGAVQGVVRDKKYCPDCKKKYICGGGCRARAIASHNGDLIAPDITSCIFHKEII